MAHRLHEISADFELHYSFSNRFDAGFLDDFDAFPWADKVRLHISSEGTRMDLNEVLANPEYGWFIYACGPDGYMDAIRAAADRNGWPCLLYTSDAADE